MKKKLLQEQKEKAIIESFAKTFNKIKRLDENEISEEALEELNLKKGLATLGLAASMMGAPKDAAAQTQMPQQQGIEKSVSNASALGLPQDNRKAGKVVMDSYTKNPFTADMWSKKSRENLRFFKTLKKLVDYYMGGGQVDDTDFEELGAMAKQSPVAMDFMQR
jgi:hypothetical protein